MKQVSNPEPCKLRSPIAVSRKTNHLTEFYVSMEGRDSMGLHSQGPFARPSTAPNAIAIHGASNVNMMKRKRGRPRKYGPDGSMALALSPFSALTGMAGSSSQKRGRGRPPGTGRKQQMAALGSAGVGFTPHVITIAAGEDIATKIMSFSQQGPRAVCILSASGAISNVTVRQPAASGGTVTYEGRFDIVSLSGSFLLMENNGARSRTGGLSISLAGPDGRVIGGVVAGMLMAASPVQVIAGSFILDGKKVPDKPENNVSSFGLPHGAASGHSGAKHGGPGSSPFNPSSGASAISSVGQLSTQNAATFQSMGWRGSHSMGEQRHATNVNISLPCG